MAQLFAWLTIFFDWALQKLWKRNSAIFSKCSETSTFSTWIQTENISINHHVDHMFHQSCFQWLKMIKIWKRLQNFPIILAALWRKSVPINHPSCGQLCWMRDNTKNVEIPIYIYLFMLYIWEKEMRVNDLIKFLLSLDAIHLLIPQVFHSCRFFIYQSAIDESLPRLFPARVQRIFS